MNSKLFLEDKVSDDILSDLDRREIALWVRDLPEDPDIQNDVCEFLRLPWKMVLSEVSDPKLIKLLEKETDATDVMMRKRGPVQIIEGDVSRIEMPQRCLPIYLLNGRQENPKDDFKSQLSQMVMLDELRRSNVRQILIISGDGDPVPSGLRELFSSGFRSSLVFSSQEIKAESILNDWADETNNLILRLLHTPIEQIFSDTLRSYNEIYPEERHIIRLRNLEGKLRKLDVTELDDPSHSILEKYSLIEERDLAGLIPDQLTEGEFESFFQDTTISWKPYAAGLPWLREDGSKKKFQNIIKDLDTTGSDENCIAYVRAESGAGGTTFTHMLAWEYAQRGYPVLVAKQFPFSPDALPVTNFINRVRSEIEKNDSKLTSESRRYEVPWIIVFDRMHVEHRDTELRRFQNEMKKSGRPACLLVVSGPIREMSFYDRAVFKEIGELNHSITQEESRELGKHLNKFLSVYGKDRKEMQWDKFYRDHTIRYVDGVAVFWVSLSFWIRGQYDLTESIQQWMYRSFKGITDEKTVRNAILEIAALSSERFPMPEEFLQTEKGDWPVSHRLQDNRSSLGSLGLVRISAEGKWCWALIHDILGRFIINALFYDFESRKAFGFEDAKDPEHLRFMLLRRISKRPELGERDYRSFGDDFARHIFKIDPDHGHDTFAPFWKEVFQSLDAMTPSLKDGSRVFRHHTAISRRRIAKIDQSSWGVTMDDKIRLLSRAVEDIDYALKFIEYTPESEPDLNLYNSIAHALHDLADLEEKRGVASKDDIKDFRRRAHEAIHHAYQSSPTSPFVVETYVRDLLSSGNLISEERVESCLRALEILFSVSSSRDTYRINKIGELIEKSLKNLFKNLPKGREVIEPNEPIQILINAWILLTDGIDYSGDVEYMEDVLSNLPEDNRVNAIKALSHPAGKGDMQIIRLNYQLTRITYPFDFYQQLDYLQQIHETDYNITPQMRLEYGLLLYQNNRYNEGGQEFQILRKLWSESEHFVHVPDDLHWLLDSDRKTRKTVRAIISSGRGLRPMAKVEQFQQDVPFRMEEFSLPEARPGKSIFCHVTFSHNGPFLRPITAR